MKKIFLVFLFAFLAVNFSGAQEMTEKEEEDKLYESIEKELERLENFLELEDWQMFRIDSVLFHDITAMKSAIKQMSDAKIGNANMYVKVQDEWYEKMYNAYRSILNDEQWAKYLKNGAAKAKKMRDKRKESKK